MGEFIIFLIIFVGVISVSVLVFGGWFLVMLVRGIAGFLGMRGSEPAAIGHRRPSGARQIGPVPPPLPGAAAAYGPPCPYELCKSPNDPHARFCRRCGRKLAAQHVNVRRAAAW